MLARSYESADAKGLDVLLENNRHGIVSLRHDNIFVTGKLGEPTGALVYRPGAFVHELVVRPDLLAHRRADELGKFAIEHAVTHEHKLVTAIFLVKADNVAMQRWCKSIGAILQSDPGDLLYTLTP